MSVIDKLNNSYRENRIYYFMVLIFFCVGIALGAFMVKYMNINDSTDLSNYFSSFTESILVSQVENTKLFFNILIKISITVVIIIILGFTVFGIPFILLIDLIKGFTLGYTFTFLLTTFNGKGIWLAIVSILPQNIFYIPSFIALSIISIEFSATKLRYKFFNKGTINTIVKKELIFKIGVLVCTFIIGVFIESYICPNLMKFIVTKIT